MSDDHDAAFDQAAPPAVEPDYPYVGPLTFTRNEADRFFGREREARDLLALVARERLVLFFAQSGAVTDLAFDPAQPDLLVAVIDNHTLPQVWDLDQRREFAAVQRLVSPIQVQSEKPIQESPVSVALDTASRLSISPDGQQIGVIDATGSPFVVNLAVRSYFWIRCQVQDRTCSQCKPRSRPAAGPIL